MANEVLGSLAGTIVKGQRKTSDIASARKVPQFTGKTVNVNMNVAPIYALTRKLGNSRTVAGSSYFHLQTDYLPTVVTVNGALNDSATTLVVATDHAKRINPRTTLKVLRTGEILLVTAVASGTSCTIERAYGGTTAYAILDTEEINILSFADSEGNTAPDAISSEPTPKTNYTQTYRQAIEWSGRDMASAVYGEAEQARTEKDAQESLMVQIEKSWLFQNGIQANTMTGGIEYWLSSNVTNVGGLMTETAFNNWLRGTLRRNAGVKSASLCFFAGELVRKAMTGWAFDRLRYMQDDDVHGIYCSEYTAETGQRIKIVPHALMSPTGSSNTAANLGWSGYGMLLNMDNIGRAEFKGRGWRKRTDIEAPGTDGKKSEYITDEGLDLMNEASHGILKGVTG